jgi:AAA15 family ATPase/GTPase
MIIEFTVKNFRSIKEPMTLSMVAGAMDEHDEVARIDSGLTKLSLLPSAILYGPNAAGKSNLIGAFNAMRSLVLTSSKLQRGDELDVMPHLFDAATSNQPTEFEVVFIAQGVRYQYGFAATREKVHEEWLIAYPKGKPQRWIDRQWVAAKKKNIAGKYSYAYSKKFTGPKKSWEELTTENALYLSVAIQRNNEQLRSVFDWFQNMTRVTNSGSMFFTAAMCESKKGKEQILKFLKAADSDIQGFDVKLEKFDESKLPKAMPLSMKEHYKGVLKDAEKYEVKTIHSVIGGETCSLGLEEESDGTQRLFWLAGLWLEALSKGKILFVDELHESLHPKLLRFLVAQFHNPKVNRFNAQLIFTTHDTSILDQKFLRRDQVWFVEKKPDNSSLLYSLMEFSPRKDREQLERSYLEGRYGALPYFKNITDAMGMANGK